MKKIIALFVGAVWIGGCALIQSAGGDDIRLRLQYLEEQNQALNADLGMALDRVAALEADARARAGEPVSTITGELPHAACRQMSGIEEQVRCVARAKGFDEDLAAQIVACESGFDPDALGPNSREGRPEGLWQIKPRCHQDIAIEDIHDPVASTAWAIDRINEGWGPRWWACYPGARTRHHHGRGRK